MKRLLIGAALLASMMVASAEQWEIAEHLKVSSAEGLDVTFQASPDLGIEEPYIHGWKGDSLEYLVMPDVQGGGISADDYWAEFAKVLEGFKVLHENKVTTHKGLVIGYKTFQYIDEGSEVVQLLALVIGEKVSYAVMALPINGDIQYTTSNFEALLKTVELD